MNWNYFLMPFLVLLPWCLCQADDYVYPEERLLHVRKFNQTCEHEGQCSDHRLSCNIEENTNEKRCLCVKYHTFDEFSQQCLVAENMTDMLTQLIEHYDAQADEAVQAEKIFTGMMVAGFLVLGVGLIMAAACTIIACYRPSLSRKDQIKYETASQRRRSASRDRPSTSAGRAVSPQSDGTVDYFQGMFNVAI